MTTTPDLQRVVEQFQAGLDAFFRGDPGPCKLLMSRRDDVTLANPFGPIALGWAQVEATMDHAGQNYRGGAATGFEMVARYTALELAYTVWVERFKTRMGPDDALVAGALRRTTIYRLEPDGWRIAHTHADPITTPRGAESLVKR